MSTTPSEPSLADRRLHPASLVFSFMTMARRLLLPAIVAFAVSPGRGEVWLAILFVPLAIGATIRYVSYRYRLGEEELVVRHGLLNRTERHVPYARIQNVNLTQNLLHRWLGVAEVQLETAGGDEPEATMRVLSLDAVETIRERVFVARRAAASPDAASADGAEGGEVRAPAARDVLIRMSAGDVALFGLLSNRGMVMVAAAIGVISQLDVPGFDVSIEGLIRRAVERAQDLPLPSGVVSVAVVAALVVAAVALLRVLSMLWALLRFHGFVLSRRGDDLRTERGLLTRVTATVPRHRIQLVSLQSGVLHRWAGRVGMRVETAGGVGRREGDAAAERLWLAPLARTDEAERLVETLLPGLRLDALAWRSLSARAGGRLARRNVVLAALPAAGLTAAGLATGYAWWWGASTVLPLAGLGLLLARLYVRHTSWALADDTIVYRSGWWTRRLSAVPFAKIQAVESAASLFDRRRRMARIRVDTAGAGRVGHRVAVAYLDAATVRSVHDLLEREASARAFRW